MTTTTAEWLLEISGLTVGTTADDVVDHGQQLAAQVQAAAGAFRSATACTTTTGCVTSCPLADIDGGAAACRLAEHLAPDALRSGPPGDARRAAIVYVQALRAASTAVFHCRRQAHVTGDCWFEVDGTPMCGDVLAVAHRMGT